MSELLLNPRVIFLAFIWGLFLVLFLRALTHQRVASRQAQVDLDDLLRLLHRL